LAARVKGPLANFRPVIPGGFFRQNQFSTHAAATLQGPEVIDGLDLPAKVNGSWQRVGR